MDRGGVGAVLTTARVPEGATVLVVGAGKTSRRQVRTAIERLALISVRPTATILNQSKSARGSSYYIIDEKPPGESQSDGARQKPRKAARS